MMVTARSAAASAAAVVAVVVCLLALSTPLGGSEGEGVSLVSVAQARALAAKDEVGAHLDFGRAKQDAELGQRDRSLADKDLAVRRSILKAAAGEKRVLKEHGRAMTKVEAREATVLRAMKGLEGGVAEAKVDEARSAWRMHEHVLASDRILGELRSLTADKALEGRRELSLDRAIGSTDGKLRTSLALLRKGEGVLRSGRQAEARIADRARQAAAEGRYEDSVDRALQAQSRMLQRSAVRLQKRGGRGASEGIQQLAAREMSLEKEAGGTAVAVAKLKSRAREAQGYVGLLQGDMRAAEGRVEEEAGRVEDLYQRAKRERLAAMVAVQRQRMLGDDVQRGVRGVVANEEAFRRDEARLRGDEKAVTEVRPRLRETRQTLRSMAKRVGRDIGREEREGLAYVGDLREAQLLRQSQSLHDKAGQAAAEASAVHGKSAELMLDQGRRYLDLSKVDLEDARDSRSVAVLERARGD